MAIKAIAHSYWRRVKAGGRTFEAVPETVQDDVRTLAQEDVRNGVISAEEYLALIGEEYSAAE